MIKRLLVGLAVIVLASGAVRATTHATVSIKGRQYTGEVLNTTGNHLDIEEDDMCVYDAQVQCVACQSGKIFGQVSHREGSSTGTPGFLVYPQYIGTVRLQRGNMPGAGRRRDFWVTSTNSR